MLAGVVAEKADTSKVNLIETEVQKNTSTISNNTARLTVLEGDGEGSIKKAIAEGIAEIVVDAPEDLNTLKEVADYIASDKTKANEIETAISDLGVKDTQLEASINTNATAILSKQPLLTGDEFKTINDESIMGEGNIEFPKVEIANDLTTGGANKALSAEMGKVLNEELGTKAPKIGYAPDLKVNFAKELVGRGEATPEVIGGIRPTGEISIGDGNATITKIKGESVVWNQLVVENQREVIADDIRTSYDPITKLITIENISRTTFYNSGSTQIQLTDVIPEGHIIYVPSVKDEPAIGLVQLGGGITLFLVEENRIGTSVGKSSYLRINNTYDFVNKHPIGDKISFHLPVYDLTLMFGSGKEPETIEDFEVRKPLGVSDEYNEGTIISYDGSALKSVGFNAWDEEWELGSITNTGEFVTSTDRIRNKNRIKVLPNTQYKVEAEGYSEFIVYQFDVNGGFISATPSMQLSFRTNERCSHIYFRTLSTTYKYPICIHLAHTYNPERYPNGYAPYEADIHPLPNIESILDADGNKLFPNGLLSAGSVHDEITATKAVKRVGVVDMGTLGWWTNPQGPRFTAIILNMKNVANWNKIGFLNATKYKIGEVGRPELEGNIGVYINQIYVQDNTFTDVATFKATMQGVLLYYELATPIEVDLPEELNMTYDAWDFGTEELVAEGKTTPLNADIVYQFNAVDRIRENTTNVSEIEEEVATKQDELTLTVLDNGNIRIGNLQGQTKDFMPATPSGDPMHYAYEALGAVYNNGADVIAQTPWSSFVDDADYNAKWGLNVIPDNATFVKTLKYNGVDREVWQMQHPNKNFQILVVAEYASDGTKIWDDTLVVKRSGMWYKDGLGDLTNADMNAIINDPHPTKTEGSCATNKGRLLKFNNGITNADPAAMFLYANKNIEVWIRGYFQTFASVEVLSQAYIRHIVSSDYNNYTATINLNLNIPYISTIYMKAGKNITLNMPNISAKSIIGLIENTSFTVTVTFPSALYERLMDTSTTLGAELVALLESKSNITFARGE